MDTPLPLNLITGHGDTHISASQTDLTTEPGQVTLLIPFRHLSQDVANGQHHPDHVLLVLQASGGTSHLGVFGYTPMGWGVMALRCAARASE